MAKNDGKPGFLRKLFRVLIRLGLVGIVMGIGIAIAGAILYHHYVISEPGEHLAPDHIRSIIANESPVYYRDGTTRVGVFFEDEHREYLAFEEIPNSYIVGIVAAEDGAFWSHPGLNAKHIFRAAVQNLMSGKIVGGGSSLTQQTAKNLYYRPDRSVKSKLTEMLNALRLEAHYSKTDILTFYVNQFHVAGNGRGLGIASRYFFDRSPQELSLVENAFLAGVVKGPSNYDPFIGSADRQEAARKRANDRTAYVLRRIVDQQVEDLAGPLPDDTEASRQAYRLRVEEARAVQVEAKRLLDEGFSVPFRKGTFRYDSSAIVDEVGRRLKEAPFDEVLREAGITDPATAGLQVITTLDVDAQREAVYGLWHHLTEIGILLEGIERVELDGARSPLHEPERLPKRHEFRIAQITGLEGGKGKKFLRLNLGGSTCVVDRAGVERIGTAIWRGKKKDRGAKPSATWLDEWATSQKSNQIVWASIREVPVKGEPLCDLEVRPKLQGAVVALEAGQVRAMVGGNDNRNFNRATALRQLGSTWKPIIYHAALELGWSPTDALDNGRNVFPFSGTFYYPSPDHDPLPVVSLAWAGVNSENLASVWLLYHLTDRLNTDQVATLAEAVGLARQVQESEQDYRLRIQKEGILPTPGRIAEAIYLQSRYEVWTGVSGSRHPEDALALESMIYGWGLDSERSRVAGDPVRRRAVDLTWQNLESRWVNCVKQSEQLQASLADGMPDGDGWPDLYFQREELQIHVACGVRPEGFDTFDATWVEGASMDALEDWSIEGRFHGSTLRALTDALQRRQLAREVSGDAELYSPEWLYWHQDFRTLLGIKVVARLASEYGVRTEIQQVMSLPLGASEISLEEQTAVYEGLITGSSWDFVGEIPGLLDKEVAAVPAPTLLIAEIRDVDGRVLYRATPKAREVAPPAVGRMTADILRNVVQFGTGQRASSAVKMGVPAPVGGKTGTTNDYRNVAFIGYVPKWMEDITFSSELGYTLGVYVGYDDNRSLTTGGVKIAGASGALPVWIVAAQGMADANLLGHAEGGEQPVLEITPGLKYVLVDSVTGLRKEGDTSDPKAATVVVMDESQDPALGAIETLGDAPRRPIRIAPSGEDALNADKARELDDPADIPSVWGED